MTKFMPHQLRVIAERDELSVRVYALEDFINVGATFRALSDRDQTLLREQLTAMHSYLSILNKRISYFGDSK